jgi:MoaA/NifB/PqqE/SkfB family radical SAM enzyme
LIDGKHNWAVYDLKREDIVALEPEMAAILRLAEGGSPTHEIASLLAKDPGSVEDTLNKVAIQALGRFYNRRVYIEKDKQHRRRDTLTIFAVPPVISKCYIELACTCGLECSFCKALKVYPCGMCSKASSGQLDERNLYAFLKRLLKMQCMSLVFHGGDPLAHQDKFFSMVEFCRAQGFKGEIFVITNGTNIKGAVIRSLVSYKVHPVIPFAQEIGGLISESMLDSLAQAFWENQIKFTLTLVINSDNASSTERMRDIAERLGAMSILQTAVLDEDGNRSSEAVEALGKQMMRVSRDVFYHNAEYHPCLNGTLALSTGGRLLPCPFLTDEVLGSSANPWLVDQVFETRMIDRYWELNLSQVEGCKDCAFRYGCLDCRAVEKHLSTSLYGKRTCALNKRVTR